MWSDIVKFVQLGINIAQKIGLNPAEVRRQIVFDIDHCFHRAGGLTATYWQKVGADGWFHFYRDPTGPKAVQLAIDAMAQVRQIVNIKPLYNQQDLKVVMGINEVKNVQLDPGGPIDDDSIIAYLLLKERYKQYDLRATQNAVLNLVDKSQNINGRNMKILIIPTEEKSKSTVTHKTRRQIFFMRLRRLKRTFLWALKGGRCLIVEGMFNFVNSQFEKALS